MSFEIYVPVTRATNLQAGEASIDTIGNVRLTQRDLDAVGISERATILLDRGTGRLALRTPRNDKNFTEPALRVSWNKSKSGATIGLRGPLKELGKLPESAARSNVQVKDDLLILDFSACVTADTDAPERKSGRPRRKLTTKS